MSDDITPSRNRAGLRSLKSWCDDVGTTAMTAWRWRKAGWLKTVNIAGRVYVTSEAAAEFKQRAESGEFAKEHKVPALKPSDVATAQTGSSVS